MVANSRRLTPWRTPGARGLFRRSTRPSADSGRAKTFRVPQLYRNRRSIHAVAATNSATTTNATISHTRELFAGGRTGTIGVMIFVRSTFITARGTPGTPGVARPGEPGEPGSAGKAAPRVDDVGAPAAHAVSSPGRA